MNVVEIATALSLSVEKIYLIEWKRKFIAWVFYCKYFQKQRFLAACRARLALGAAFALNYPWNPNEFIGLVIETEYVILS